MTQQNIIKRFMRALDMTNAAGRKALDAAVNYSTGGYFKTFQAAVNQMVKECKTLGADKFLLQQCGINLSNTDTGAITGADAGGSKVKTAESIVPESGKLDTTFKDTSFKVDGVTFRLEATSLSSNETYMWQALKAWWAREGLKLNAQSYGYSFSDTDVAAKEIVVTFKNEKSRSYLAYVAGILKVDGRPVLNLVINSGCFSRFVDGDVNGKSTKYTSYYLDRTLAHEFTHALMMAKVNNYSKLPTFMTEGLGELTRGIDDLRSSKIKTLAKNSTLLKNTLDVEKAGTSVNSYAGGYIFLRWLAKQGAQNYLSTYDEETITLSGKTLTLTKNFSGKVLDLDDYSSKIKTVRASALDTGILIYGNDNANFLIGGSGNDTLIGGKGNDSLKGGAGKNIFVYSAGDDVITDWSADDKISLTAAIGDTTLDGSDVVFSIGSGSFTVKDGKGKTLNVITSGGERYSTVLGGTTLTLTNAATSPVTADDEIKIIDASARTKAIEIVGNSKANSILGGAGNDTLAGGKGNDSLAGGKGNDSLAGGAGNDSLDGGAGNDTLWGDAGNDKFFCAAGDDIIFGFEDGDTLTLDALDFKTSYSKKKSVIKFKFDDGSVTLQDFSATTFHVNDSVYSIVDDKLVKS